MAGAGEEEIWREGRGQLHKISGREALGADMTDEVKKMVLKRQMLHSVGGSGKMVFSEKMLEEAGFVPGMFVEVVVKKGSINIFPYFRDQRWKD